MNFKYNNIQHWINNIRQVKLNNTEKVVSKDEKNFRNERCKKKLW